MSAHSILKKIYYHDTDCGGVVYYANYLKYLEEARTEYLSSRNIELKNLSDDGVLLVVKEASLSYKSPARYGDVVQIETRLEKIKNATLWFAHTISANHTPLVTATAVLVCVNTNFRPVSIPETVRNALQT